MIGQWFQKAYEKETPERQAELKEFTYDLLLDLFENEVDYTRDLYDEMNLTVDVTKFLKYNANKSLQNLGFEAMFPKDQTDVSASIISALGANSDENHDFFSGSGSSYVIGKVEDTTADDWAF
jgi:ribonucleoside-diphosphate reductase beta chain